MLFLLICQVLVDPAIVGAAGVPRGGPLTVPAFVTAASNSSASATSLTLTGFTVSGSNPYLIVGTAGNATITARSVNSLTMNGGANLTNFQVYRTNFAAHGNSFLYAIPAASLASGDIVVTYSGANNAGMVIMAVLVSGTTSTGAVGGVFSASAGSTTMDLSSVATDLVADFTCVISSAWTPGGSQASRSTASATGINGVISTVTGSAGTTTISDTGATSAVTQLGVVFHGL